MIHGAMTSLLKLFVFGALLVLDVSAYAGTYGFVAGTDLMCYVDRRNGDIEEFWYCGNQGKGCSGVQHWREDKAHWLNHGDKFTYTRNGGEGTYYCCGGTTSKYGAFVHADKWIHHEQKVDKKVTGGTCTYYLRYNVCDPSTPDPSLSDPECTLATGSCDTGYVSHGGRCVEMCKEGYVFESETSNTCIKCETTERQDIVKGACKKCETNEVLDKKTLECMTIEQIEQRRLAVTRTAQDQCWLCDTPETLDKCLRYITAGHALSDNEELSKKCALIQNAQ